MVRNINIYALNMSNSKQTTVDSGTQTVIRVYPHILDQYTCSAQVTSDKKLQTEISIKAEERNNNVFYSLLRFTPYRDIQENSIRIIDLPRKVRLHFTPRVEFENMAETARKFSLADDDGVGYICCELIHRLERKKRQYFVDANVQTDLKVSPHLLQANNVAVVFDDMASQTSC